MKAAARPRVQTILATVLACLIAVSAAELLDLLATQKVVLSWLLGPMPLDFSLNIARYFSNLFEHPISANGLMVDYSGSRLTVTLESAFGSLDSLTLLAMAALVAVIAAARTWGFKKAWTITGIILGTLVPLPLLLLLSGLFAGTALGLSQNVQTAIYTLEVARDAAHVLACAFIFLIGWLALWLTEDPEKLRISPAPRYAFACTTSMWIAISTSLLLAAQCFLASLGALITENDQETIDHRFVAVRWSIAAALLVVAAAMLIISALCRNRLARWSWIPLLVAAPCGGPGLVVPFLAAVISARDERFRAARTLPLQPSAPERIRRRIQRPLALWIWLLVGVIAWGVFLRRLYLVLDASSGLLIPAHPAFFIPILLVTFCLGFMDWNRIRRRSRLINSSVFLLPVLLTAGAIYAYGYHRQTVWLTQVAAAEPYFQKVDAVLHQLPFRSGPWAGQDIQLPKSLFQLPIPTLVLSRKYTDGHRQWTATMIIADARNPRDLIEYSPPIFYPSNGESLLSTEPAEWEMESRRITGREYAFEHETLNGTVSTNVASFIITPAGPFLPDLDALIGNLKQSQEPEARGAAIVHIITTGDLPPESRRQIVTELLTLASPALETLAQGQ